MENRRYICPKCGIGGANDINRYPLCHICDYLVVMLPGGNNHIIISEIDIRKVYDAIRWRKSWKYFK